VSGPTRLADVRPLALCDEPPAASEPAILGEPPEPGYDDLAALAAIASDARVGAIVLAGRRGLTVKAAAGSIDNEYAALTLAAAAMRIPVGFAIHPAPGQRVSAAMAIDLDGERVGAVCAIDLDLDALTPPRRQALQAVARQAARQLALLRRDAELQILAVTDPLTGVGNRRLLYDTLERALAETEGERTAGVVFCDIDEFKRVNDRHGHEAGDDLLCAFARALDAATDCGDIVIRIAGDEFVVVCPQRTASELEATAARIRAVVCPSPEPGARPARISVGAALGRSGDLPGDVLRRADEAMYAEKAIRSAARRLARADRLPPRAAADLLT
jgi:diguanylate cyclase (GGDEF)-like protein